MKINSRMRWQLRIQSAGFVVLFVIFLGLCGWLSSQFKFSIDLTSNQRNSLSVESLRLLQVLEEPLSIRLFISPVNENAALYASLFERYAIASPRVNFESLNPDLYPQLLRDNDIRYDGEALIEYQGRSEKLLQVSEAGVTQAIQRLLRSGERYLVFLQGHGERNPYSEANHDYSLLAQQLASKGFSIQTLQLTETADVPANVDVLIIASPRFALLPGEIQMLEQYVESGGNLLWLADPEQIGGDLDYFSESLDVELLPGLIVDPNSQLLGLDSVDFAVAAEYPFHPVTQNLNALSLFPQARGLRSINEQSEWQIRPIINSNAAGWSELGDLSGEIRFGDNENEIAGPLPLVLSLQRSLYDEADELEEQRIIIAGDADFLSNRYLGNGANLDIGVNLMNWLSEDDSLIAITPKPAPDTQLELSSNELLIIGSLFLFILPAGLLGSGLFIWQRRRKS